MTCSTRAAEQVPTAGLLEIDYVTFVHPLPVEDDFAGGVRTAKQTAQDAATRLAAAAAATPSEVSADTSANPHLPSDDPKPPSNNPISPLKQPFPQVSAMTGPRLAALLTLLAALKPTDATTPAELLHTLRRVVVEPKPYGGEKVANRDIS